MRPGRAETEPRKGLDMTISVHEFDSSSEAYDASQYRDDIHSGDVLRVPSEGIVGILVEAWPVAIVGGPGAFHTIEPGAGDGGIREQYAESIALAKSFE